MEMSHMRIGIKTNPQHTEWARLVAIWRKADEVDIIDSAWVFDHFYPIKRDPDGPCLEGWVALSALAQATSRVKVGSMVNAMPYRHPAVTANMAATLDIVSEGRLQLGLGAGWYQREADAYGITLGDDLTERFDRFDEGVEIVVRMLSQEQTTFEGKYFTVSDARSEPKGPQQPHPPIVIGGSGERRTLKTAARWADHWNADPFGQQEWDHKVSVLEAHCADIGRDPSEIVKSMAVRPDPDDIHRLPQKLQMLADMGVDEAIVSLKPPHHPDQVLAVAEAASRVT
jgi:F420-dependent oxidoreductase-like protein